MSNVQTPTPASLDRYTLSVREFLEGLLSEKDLPLYTMVRYHLGWVDAQGQALSGGGGKGLRSTLLLLVVEALGGKIQQAMPAAAALELAHNFSLVHDDIEDHSPQRRHRDTVWRLWGEPQAINTGDTLFILARLALLRLSDRGVPPEGVVELAQRMEESCLSLCEGQFLDLDFQSRTDVTEADYHAMIEGKTAALMAASCGMGALLGGASPQQLACFGEVGRRLGLAFQIRDDVLGLWGEPETLGKLVGEDLRERKRSLPIIYGLAHATGADQAALMQVYLPEPLDEAAVHSALNILTSLGAQEYAQAAAVAHAAAAQEQLVATGLANPAVEDLQALIQFSVERRF